jgi:hypothetical protein
MVFRGFKEDSNCLLSITDTRSVKMQDWSRCDAKALHAEICWYLAKTREQYRLTCNVSLVDSNTHSDELQKFRRINWENLSLNAQKAFYEPTPGVPIEQATEEEATKESNATKTQCQDTNKESKANITASTVKASNALRISENFVVVIFTPLKVDYLDLKSTPHLRLVSSAQKQWEELRVNA